MAEIQLSGVSMVYPNGTQALKQVDLTIPDHEFIVLLGPSGCGKSTLLRLIAGLEKPTEGTLRFDGEDVSTLEPMKRNVAMVFQSFALYPHLTVYKNMAFPLKSMKLPQEEIKRRVEAAAKILDIDYLLNRRPRVLSGGQRQRICIARALALNPEFIVCDEPVSALDVSIQAQIINLLNELQDKYKLTYLFISHDLSVVEHISDTVGVMYLGNLVEYGAKEDIFRNPLHPYTKALFSAIPIPDPKVKMNRIVLEGSIPSPANPPKGCKFHTRCANCMACCKEEAPVQREIEPGHFVCCHLYDK